MGKSLLISLLIVLMPLSLLQASDSRSASQEYRTANELFASAQFREALSLYQRLVLAPPEGIALSDIHTRIGDSWFRLGYFKNALGAYRAALQLQNDAERPSTQYWIGFCCFLLGKNAEAKNEFLKIPALYPGSGMWVGTAYYWAARVCERMGQKGEAAEYYRRAGGNGKSTQGKFALKKAETVKRK